MTAAGAVLVLANRGGHVPATTTDDIVIAALIAALTIASVFVFLHLRRASRRPKRVSDQWQALAVMGELCPHGWQAQITLYGWGAPVPHDAPRSRVPQVELEWKEFEDENGQIAVARRVWAPTIGEALQTMVDDRRTDFVLEEIERIDGEGNAA